MGQAKQRGTRQERVEAAIERDKAVELAREGRRIELANRGLDRIAIAGVGAARRPMSGLGYISLAMSLAKGGGIGK